MKIRFDTVHHTDCLRGMQSMEKESVDLAFADPPFNIGFNYDVYDDSRDGDEYVSWCREWIGEIVRVLKPDGTFWLAIGDEYAADLKVMMQRELHLVCRSWVVWYYTFGVNCKYKFSRSHAHLLYMVKDPKQFTFNSETDSRAVRAAACLRRFACQSEGTAAGRHVDPAPPGLARQFPAPGRYLVLPARGGNL